MIAVAVMIITPLVYSFSFSFFSFSFFFFFFFNTGSKSSFVLPLLFSFFFSFNLPSLNAYVSIINRRNRFTNNRRIYNVQHISITFIVCRLTKIYNYLLISRSLCVYKYINSYKDTLIYIFIRIVGVYAFVNKKYYIYIIE